MEKGISYLNRNFNDYKDALIEYSKRYYPDLNNSYDDASVGTWMIDLVADVADNLSYHIDRVYQETNIDSAQEKASLYALARNNGIKIPGPKGSMAEVRISFVLPVDNDSPDYDYAPIVKRGTKFSSTSQTFELLNDVDFKSQFDENGNSDRTITPNLDTNGITTGYTVSKLAVVCAGETRIYRYTVYPSDVKPFMEILIPVEGIMNIESILCVTGSDNEAKTPSYGDFYTDNCNNQNNQYQRYYEVDNLAQSWAWTDLENNGKPVVYQYGYNVNGKEVVTQYITRGQWLPIKYKFITEYTDKGYLKVIFGSGNDEYDEFDDRVSPAEFSEWQMTRILNNNNMGVLPKENSTLFILYRVGGGKTSNVAKGAINKVSVLNAEFRSNNNNNTIANEVYRSMTVENTTPSVSGKDMPSENELKYLIKYNKGSQERCVTVKDYIDRILRLPPKYGTPFRVGVMEENNKIMVYLLGINNNGKLENMLPVTLINNIEDYLSGYRMINDYVEIKSGKIINISIDLDVTIDKNYEKSDVVRNIITVLKNYFDINKHFMGDDFYISDTEKEISKIDGVINIIGLRVYNEHNGSTYSSNQINQEVLPIETEGENRYLGNNASSAHDYVDLIDLEATDGIIYTDGDSMLEIKYPETDIRIRIKEK